MLPAINPHFPVPLADRVLAQGVWEEVWQAELKEDRPEGLLHLPLYSSLIFPDTLALVSLSHWAKAINHLLLDFLKSEENETPSLYKPLFEGRGGGPVFLVAEHISCYRYQEINIFAIP